MKTVFDKRRRQFRHQCLRYLRYVLNDHFVLFLTIGFGFVMVQYGRLLKELPASRWPLHLAIILVGLALVFWGGANAHLEKADQQFLLPKEEELIQHIRRVGFSSFIGWGILQTAILFLLLPLALKLGWPIWGFLLYVLLVLVARGGLYRWRQSRFVRDGRLNWERAISHDMGQKQRLLKFFSLFTTVKGISQTVKRRAFLDVCLSPFKGDAWTYLLARAFLRSGDYLALALRLLSLSLLSLIFIEQELVAVALVLLFNYLLLFQLLALYHHYDYQGMTRLFPLDHKMKAKSLLAFLRYLSYGLLGLETLVGLIFFTDRLYLLILIIGQLLISQLYLAYKIEKSID